MQCTLHTVVGTCTLIYFVRHSRYAVAAKRLALAAPLWWLFSVVNDVCRLMTFVTCDVRHLMPFAGYDVCRLMPFVG